MSSTKRGLVIADSIESGEVDIPAVGTPVQIKSASTPCFRVIVSNINAASAIYVGDSAVDKTSVRGVRLNTGEQVAIDVDDASKVYVDGTTNGDDAGFLILK